MDYTHWRGGIEIPPIKELCKTLEAKFLEQENENKRLSEENRKLKENIWEKEEIARLKERHDRMGAELRRGFGISEEQQARIADWKTVHKTQCSGGSHRTYTYKFTPTHLGTIGLIQCSCGETFEFQEL